MSSGTNLCFHCFILGKFRHFTSAWRIDRETGEKCQSTPRLEATPPPPTVFPGRHIPSAEEGDGWLLILIPSFRILTLSFGVLLKLPTQNVSIGWSGDKNIFPLEVHKDKKLNQYNQTKHILDILVYLNWGHKYWFSLCCCCCEACWFLRWPQEGSTDLKS